MRRFRNELDIGCTTRLKSYFYNHKILHGVEVWINQAVMKINRRKISLFCIAVAAAWLAMSYALFLISGKIIYKTSQSHGEDYGFKFERAFVKNSSGDDIELLWVPGPAAGGEGTKTFLYLHGNAGRLPHIIEGLSGYGSVLSPAYPGYSRSGGTPGTANINETVDLSMKYLRNMGIRDEDVVIMGHSLGGSPAVYAAANYPGVDRVVLANTFLSVEEMCKDAYHILCMFSGGIHNTAEMAPRARAAIRQFHNRDDAVVPFSQGRRLFDLLGSKDKVFFELSGSHADFPVVEILKE